MPQLHLGSLALELDAVLFDVGGTLLRFDHAYLAACAARHGHPVEVDALMRAEAGVRREIDRRASAAGGVRDRDADRLVTYYDALLAAAGVAREPLAAIAAEAAAEHLRDNLWRVPLPGVHDALAGLRARGFRVGAVSNADGRVAQGLSAAGLALHFEVILDSHLEGVEKPDPEIFRRALTRLGVAPERALYVGDIYAIDALGARAAGLHAMVIDETGGYADLDCPTIAALGELLAAGPDAGG